MMKVFEKLYFPIDVFCDTGGLRPEGVGDSFDCNGMTTRMIVCGTIHQHDQRPFMQGDAYNTLPSQLSPIASRRPYLARVNKFPNVAKIAVLSRHAIGVSPAWDLEQLQRKQISHLRRCGCAIPQTECGFVERWRSGEAAERHWCACGRSRELCALARITKKSLNLFRRKRLNLSGFCRS